jgi:hypothetical protein
MHRDCDRLPIRESSDAVLTSDEERTLAILGDGANGPLETQVVHRHPPVSTEESQATIRESHPHAIGAIDIRGHWR